MLILHRKLDQRVILEVKGERIVICVTSIDGRQIGLGFEASPNVHIVREELVEKR